MAKPTRAAIAQADLDSWGVVPFAALIGHFASRRVGHDDAARRLLDEAAQKCHNNAWPYPIVRFLRREIDDLTLLTMATDDDKRIDALCYLGLDLLLSGRIEPAREHFRWVKEHGVASSTQYTIAVAEMDRLKAEGRH